MKTLIACAFLLSVPLSCLTGCSQERDPNDTLRLLQQGKAEGHLVLSTDGRIGVGATQEFFLGPIHSGLAFDGSVDFADRVRNVDPPTTQPAEGNGD